MRVTIWWALGLILGCSGGDDGGSVSDAPGDDDDVTTDGTDTDTDDPTDPGACASVVDVQVADATLWLRKRVTVELDAPADAWVACAAASDPNEVILVESDGPATTHTLDVIGLYEDETWTCEVAATCAGAEVATATFDTLALPASVPSFTMTSSGTPPQGTWTLLNAEKSCTGGDVQEVMIVDLQGRVRWLYEVGAGYEVDVDAWWTGDVVHLGGGWGLFEDNAPNRGTMRQVALDGTELVVRDTPDFGLGFNHHSEPLADGEVLSLTTSWNTLGNSTWHGVAVERWSPATQQVTWTWDSQQLVDDGVEGPHVGSPWHANALEWTTDALGDALWVSLYVGQEVWRIDRATGQRTHVLGRGGDFTLLDADGTPLPSSEWMGGQHDPDFLPDGRVLLYDNGVDQGSSRVLELQLDLVNATATKLWEWTEPGWYTPIIGDADYLDGGHVLVTKGVVSCLTFWLSEHSAIIELDPATNQQVWRLELDDRGQAVFRSQRYDGCDIFSNAKHCPAVAERLAELRNL